MAADFPPSTDKSEAPHADVNQYESVITGAEFVSAQVLIEGQTIVRW